jgi:5-(aminomethyl)-3-furanmethanol phosphate kinase
MRRVVKIGGSLLTRPTLVQDVDRWLSNQTAANNYVIVGGGEMIEAVRKWDRVCTLPGEAIHWQCVDLLDASFLALRSWFPDWNGIETASDLQTSLTLQTSSNISIVRCAAFYHSGASPPDVPTDWRTTTDSIAVILARQIDADEVVLLKSCAIPADADLQTLSSAGIVDEALPNLAASLPIRIETLTHQPMDVSPGSRNKTQPSADGR